MLKIYPLISSTKVLCKCSLKATVGALSDLLLPPACSLCNELLDNAGQVICPCCEVSFERLQGPVCMCCGKPIDSYESLCFDCTRNLPPVQRIRSVFVFFGAVREAIVKFKLGGHSELGSYFAAQLAAANFPQWEWSNVDLLVPVPLHRSRLRERGFNQAALLVRTLAKCIGLPYDFYHLRRIYSTPPQGRTNSRSQRFQSVKGAFRVFPDRFFKHCRVCLVDDVVTTGATLYACAQALLAAGAHSVYAVTIARTPTCS